MSEQKPRAICILGMHRSGTSAITRAINMIGTYLGEAHEMLPPGEDNPEGFWEHTGIVLLHEKILDVLSRAWSDTLPLPEKWWELPEIRGFKEELTSLVRNTFTNQSLWAWKDPRTCLLLPLWQEILDELGIETSNVIIIRNPLDVAASLERRNGFSRDHSFGLWLLYTLSSFYWSKNLKRVVVHYDYFLEDWRSCLKHIACAHDVPWPENEDELAAGMNNFLKPGLRHNQSGFEELMRSDDVPEPVKQAYQLYLEAEKSVSFLDSPEFSNKIDEMIQGYLTYSRMTNVNSMKIFIKQLEKKSQLLEKKLAEKENELAEKENELAEKENELEGTRVELARKKNELEVILNSTAWKFTRKFCYLIDRFFPPHSLRGGVIRHFKKGLKALLLAQKKSEQVQRQVQGYNNYIFEILNNTFVNPKGYHRKEKVDIILPVYNAFELTKNCIESVLKNSLNCRLIIVNDASTDSRINGLLNSLNDIETKSIEVILVHNEENLGFVKTVNRGYKYTKNHFVILNSDTEVPQDWLDRLFEPILKNEKLIASVTPFSNAAMMCSFPYPFDDNRIFKKLDLDVLNEYFLKYGSNQPIKIFTGVGFCMAFNKKITDEIGIFDEESFGRGYAEECDWSMRAYEAGYENVMVTNLFVYHKHGGSFSKEEKERLGKENLAKFWRKYDKYYSEFEHFVNNDPAGDIRNTLAMIIDAHTTSNIKRFAIMDIDMVGGGTLYSEQIVKNLRKESSTTLHFKFNFENKFLKLIYSSNNFNYEFLFKDTSAKHIGQILTFMMVDFIIINELFSWPDPISLFEQIISSEIPYLIFLHDYFFICPSWFLIDAKGKFCNIPEDRQICKKCLSNNEISGHRRIYSLSNIDAWREKVLQFFSGAKEVICFSNASLSYFLKAYPSVSKFKVIEHAIPNADYFKWNLKNFDEKKVLNIGIIGHLHHIKGEKVIYELVNHPEFNKLPINIVVFGNAPLFQKVFVSNKGQIKVHGAYNRDILQVLLEYNKISLVMIPSTWPETFSFTTSESLLLGYPVMCFNLGAPAERIKKYNCGIVIDDVTVNGIIKEFKIILQNPKIIEEWSKMTANYKPLSEKGHFEKIKALLLY